MKTRRQLSGEATDATEINISPLIDMVFILLIFFIVTTVFVEEKGLKVEKPDPSSAAEKKEENKTVVFTVTEAGQVLYEGNDIGVGGVAATVKQRIERDKEMPVIIRVNKGSIADLIVRVIDEARRAEAVNISLTPGD
ncbi:MAG: biopolymer transporter ExbD [Verrucomicrobia bacterium]|nr:MAG: biopolymer transporter ExbD [Verrucomicrobiota bacterium]